MQVGQLLVGVKVLDSLMQFVDEHFLLNNYVFAADLFERHQHYQVCIHEYLTHLTEQFQNRLGHLFRFLGHLDRFQGVVE